MTVLLRTCNWPFFHAMPMMMIVIFSCVWDFGDLSFTQKSCKYFGVFDTDFTFSCVSLSIFLFQMHNARYIWSELNMMNFKLIEPKNKDSRICMYILEFVLQGNLHFSFNKFVMSQHCKFTGISQIVNFSRFKFNWVSYVNIVTETPGVNISHFAP